MGGGYVLDFSNASFANFFGALDIEVYDDVAYPGFGDSKANRMRAFWKSASDEKVASLLAALADYIKARKEAPAVWGDPAFPHITDVHLTKIRDISKNLNEQNLQNPSPVTLNEHTSPAAATTEATVTDNKIQIEIHEEIYNHIRLYLENQDYFHAVEESYKLVRAKLKDITGKEKAHEAFSEANYEKIFGHTPHDDVEKDFFDGVKFLNMSIQFLRNEKAHTPATQLEENLAIHYVSLASLSYDLITRYVSPKTIETIEEAIYDKRRSYKNVTTFYADFENGKWVTDFKQSVNITVALRKALKEKWLNNVDFAVSYNHTNIILMRLQLVAQELTAEDIDGLLDLPTKDEHGNDQGAGILEFMQYLRQYHPDKISQITSDWIDKQG
ncbi:MAG: hypothetical protein JWM37_385 [Candidatus Saccharibacteria bacterium]|nr:hypothetical protein [Candidatus Saccharibacteria bacterium]